MRCLIWILTVSAVAAASASAQNATPNHVFQTTESVRLQLQAYNEANFTNPNESAQVEQGILPRHVLQFAERVFEKVQLLRYMNGLSTRALVEQAVVDVKPAHVNALIKEIEAEAADLVASYGVQPVAPPDLPSGKKPADVYANLERLSQSLDALGVPSTVPNDVYRIAQTLETALGELAVAADATVSPATGVASGGKTPADVYQAGLDLMADLQAMSDANGQFAIPGGIAAPKMKQGRVTPSDVNKLLLRILADLNAMKSKAGIRTVTSKPALVGGKTPTDVWLVLMACRAQAQALQRL